MENKKPVKKRKPQTFKKKPNGKNDTGKPPIPIDYKRVTELSKFLYVDRELAACLGIKFHTFRERKIRDADLREAMELGKALGCASARARLMNRVMSPDCSDAMMIHFAKNHLGHVDKVIHSNDADSPMPPAVVQNIIPTSPDEAMALFDSLVKSYKG